MLKEEVLEFESSVKKALYVCFDGMFSVILLRFSVIKAKNFICFRQKLAYEEI